MAAIEHRNWAVYVLNDDIHSFEYVIKLLVRVLRYDYREACAIAATIHEKGGSQVYCGPFETCEHFLQQLGVAGPDTVSLTNVPLRCLMKPISCPD